MLSVLIMDSTTYEFYNKYDYFFNWFEDRGMTRVCLWNRDLSSSGEIDDIVPQLIDIIKDEPCWNAYIIDRCFRSLDYLKKDFDNASQFSINPYERNRANSEDFANDSDPLLKLVYLLGGRGMEKLDYLSAYMFRAERPTNIYLITPRIFEDLGMQKRFLLRRIFNSQPRDIDRDIIELGAFGAESMQASEFWDRNEYPPNCRFMVVDMPNEDSEKYSNSWFLFWLAVFTIMQNTFNSSELGAMQLYVLSVDISEEKFSAFLNKFYTMLSEAYDGTQKEAENEIASIRAEMTDTSTHSFPNAGPVVVSFPNTDPSELFARKEEYGLMKDKPVLDEDVWEQHVNAADEETAKLFKAIGRGQREAISGMRRSYETDLPIVKKRRLSPYDIEDITEFVVNEELDIIKLQTDKSVTKAVFEDRRQKASAVVKEFLSTRVFKKVFWSSMLFGGIVFLAGFVPLIISGFKYSTGIIAALLISISSSVAVSLSAFITMIIQKVRLNNTISEYNSEISDAYGDVERGAKTQSDYLSRLLNYTEKYQMLLACRLDDERINKLNRITSTAAMYENALDQCKSIAKLCHLSLARVNLEQDADIMNFIMNGIVYLHEDTKGIEASFNGYGNHVSVPFTFVDGINLVKEEIYECDFYVKKKKDSECCEDLKEEIKKPEGVF